MGIFSGLGFIFKQDNIIVVLVYWLEFDYFFWCKQVFCNDVFEYVFFVCQQIVCGFILFWIVQNGWICFFQFLGEEEWGLVDIIDQGVYWDVEMLYVWLFGFWS